MLGKMFRLSPCLCTLQLTSVPSCLLACMLNIPTSIWFHLKSFYWLVYNENDVFVCYPTNLARLFDHCLMPKNGRVAVHTKRLSVHLLVITTWKTGQSLGTSTGIIVGKTQLNLGTAFSGARTLCLSLHITSRSQLNRHGYLNNSCR